MEYALVGIIDAFHIVVDSPMVSFFLLACFCYHVEQGKCFEVFRSSPSLSFLSYRFSAVAHFISFTLISDSMNVNYHIYEYLFRFRLTINPSICSINNYSRVAELLYPVYR